MRYLALLAALMVPQPVMAQPWFAEIMSDLSACRQRAWRDCPDTLACFQTRALAKNACQAMCEHVLAQRGATPLFKTLRADELACGTAYQEVGLSCEDKAAWRQSEISARFDAFDYALNEYPYLTKLTADEIVDNVYRVAERGFIAPGVCATTSQGRSLTLLYTTALALNHVRAMGPGSHKWEQAQALSLEWLRARRGY